MSNIFLVSAIVFLASEEADCLNESGDEVLDDCDNKVYGFTPVGLVSNMVVLSGLLAAFFMPIMGAIIDYTPHRRRAGILSALLILLIQAVQVGTVAATWFPMAILQSIGGFLYQAQVLATYAYLPETSRQVGEATMCNFTSVFVAVQFSSQAAFLLVVIVLAFALGYDDVQTGQLSQGINTVWTGIGFYIGWRLLPSAPRSRPKPDQVSFLAAGFAQIYQTAQKINHRYSRGLRWYLLSLVFAEAGINAFTTLSVVYLGEHKDLSGIEIGIFFFISLMFTLPGSKLGSIITHRLNPKRSWRLSMVALVVATAGGAAIVDSLPKSFVYLWGCFIGLIAGWFYPTENMFFSMVVPQGQEAEISGFFVYCTQILGWLPPLMFTILVEADVSQTYGVMALAIFFVIAIVLLSQAAEWKEIVAESSAPLKEEEQNDDHDDDHDVDDV